MQIVVSSAFESSIGLEQYAHLASALHPVQLAGSAGLGSHPGTAHGLGTAQWFSADLLEPPMVPELMVDSAVRPGLSMSVFARQRTLHVLSPGMCMPDGKL